MGGQTEIAPTTNKEHFQGYIGFVDVKTFAQVKRILGANRYANASTCISKLTCFCWRLHVAWFPEHWTPNPLFILLLARHLSASIWR